MGRSKSGRSKWPARLPSWCRAVKHKRRGRHQRRFERPRAEPWWIPIGLALACLAGMALALWGGGAFD